MDDLLVVFVSDVAISMTKTIRLPLYGDLLVGRIS
jgi:hypothetical protein